MALQTVLACKRDDLKWNTSSRTTRSTKAKVLIQCMAPVLAIMSCAAGYGGLWAWNARPQVPGEENDKTAKDK